MCDDLSLVNWRVEVKRRQESYVAYPVILNKTKELTNMIYVVLGEFWYSDCIHIAYGDGGKVHRPFGFLLINGYFTVSGLEVEQYVY